MYLQIPWKKQGVDYEQFLFFLNLSSKKARDTQITTRVTEGALVSRVSRRINALAHTHARTHSLHQIWRKRETARGLSKLWKVWQEKDLIFPPFQNYLQVPCQKLKKGTTEDHHEHQLTPEAGQMIYHISRVFQPTNTLQIKKKELFAFIVHSVMHAMHLSDFIQCSLFDSLKQPCWPYGPQETITNTHRLLYWEPPEKRQVVQGRTKRNFLFLFTKKWRELVLRKMLRVLT